MEYLIKRNSVASQYIEIALSFQCEPNEHVSLQLPAWRPGRYELANYAQKIRNFSVYQGSEALYWEKTIKDLWEFDSLESGVCTVYYEFYCNQMDAGGCWSDDQQLYLNFSNFCFELKGREEEQILVKIELPNYYQAATALPIINNSTWSAFNFQHLVDSPFLAAESLAHFHYSIGETIFHLWFHGKIFFDTTHLVEVFRDFTQAQVRDFGSFPASDYHFIFHLLPEKKYHGVEHAFSTVITFGPAESLVDKLQLDELIGVSSHELYHFWNVCRIRPKELLPYDLSKEVYLKTGLVMEGVTTYFGDFYLLRSGYFTLTEYLENLEVQIQREFDSLGWKSQSIIESSFDLWLDGYKAGVPHKKVSIYNRGALISLCLDLILIDSGTSLSMVMRLMWERFGKKTIGYTLEDFEKILLECSGASSRMISLLEKVVHGKEDLFPYLQKHLASVGVAINQLPNTDPLALDFGIRLINSDEVADVHPESVAYSHVMIGDVIETWEKVSSSQEVDDLKLGIILKMKRRGRQITVTFQETNGGYYPLFKLVDSEKTEKRLRWLNQ